MYKVHQYSGDGTLRGSGATVTVYTAARTYVFRVGQHGKLQGRVWYVATVDGRSGAVAAYR